MSKKQTFDYKLYRRLAKGIHDMFCEGFGWCNYGYPDPAELADDAKLPAEQRQLRCASSVRPIGKMMTKIDEVADAFRKLGEAMGLAAKAMRDFTGTYFPDQTDGKPA